MQPSENAIHFEGKGESVANYSQEVELWCTVTNSDFAKRASALFLNMGVIAREVSGGGEQRHSEPKWIAEDSGITVRLFRPGGS